MHADAEVMHWEIPEQQVISTPVIMLHTNLVSVTQ